MSRPRIEVRIGTLAMQGVEARDRPRLRRAIERELGSLLAPAAARHLGGGSTRADLASVQGGTVAVTPGHAPEAIARRIGQVVRGAVLDAGSYRPTRRG
jgi:hypothetical protein